MDFIEKKLFQQDSLKLKNIPFSSVKPFTILYTPAYVYLKRNTKFISIKGPLDFLSESDIEKYKNYESLFLSKFDEKTDPFQIAGRKARKLLLWQKEAEKDLSADSPALPPFELSDGIIQIVGPLWYQEMKVEPFFLAVFGNELCDPLPPKVLVAARDNDQGLYELGMIRSGVAVFLTLLLGYCDIDTVNAIRLQIFLHTALNQPISINHKDLEEIITASSEIFPDLSITEIQADSFNSIPLRTVKKIAGRFDRVREKLVKKQEHAPSIFGEGGFA